MTDLVDRCLSRPVPVVSVIRSDHDTVAVPENLIVRARVRKKDSLPCHCLYFFFQLRINLYLINYQFNSARVFRIL